MEYYGSKLTKVFGLKTEQVYQGNYHTVWIKSIQAKRMDQVFEAIPKNTPLCGNYPIAQIVLADRLLGIADLHSENWFNNGTVIDFETLGQQAIQHMPMKKLSVHEKLIELEELIQSGYEMITNMREQKNILLSEQLKEKTAKEFARFLSQCNRSSQWYQDLIQTIHSWPYKEIICRLLIDNTGAYIAKLFHLIYLNSGLCIGTKNIPIPLFYSPLNKDLLIAYINYYIDMIESLAQELKGKIPLWGYELNLYTQEIKKSV